MGVPGGPFGNEEANTEAIVTWIADLLEKARKSPYSLFGQMLTGAEDLASSRAGPTAIVAAAQKVYQEYKNLACAVWSLFM
jgi:hypothetical protein